MDYFDPDLYGAESKCPLWSLLQPIKQIYASGRTQAASQDYVSLELIM